MLDPSSHTKAEIHGESRATGADPRSAIHTVDVFTGTVNVDVRHERHDARSCTHRRHATCSTFSKHRHKSSQHQIRPSVFSPSSRNMRSKRRAVMLFRSKCHLLPWNGCARLIPWTWLSRRNFHTHCDFLISFILVFFSSSVLCTSQRVSVPCELAYSSCLPKGGVRKRIAEAQAVRDVVEGQSNSSSHCSGGIRRRVADSGAGFGAKNPLIDPLKLKRGKDKVSAKDVEDIIGGATAQGASQSRTWVSWRHPAVHVGVHSYHIWRQVSSTALSRERPRLWESSVRGDVGAAERYWDELQESEVLRDHPELLTEDKRMVHSVRLVRRRRTILPQR